MAWTDFVIVYFETTELPTAYGALEDLGVALLLTLLGVCWLAYAGYDSTLPQEERLVGSARWPLPVTSPISAGGVGCRHRRKGVWNTTLAGAPTKVRVWMFTSPGGELR